MREAPGEIICQALPSFDATHPSDSFQAASALRFERGVTLQVVNNSPIDGHKGAIYAITPSAPVTTI